MPNIFERAEHETQRKDIGRILLAVVVAYAVNALLVGATEEILHRILSTRGGQPPRFYFTVDLMSQILYEMIVGYVCCWIAGPSRPAALGGLIALGLVIGAVSLASSWRTEPKWYGIVLLLVWSPCIWVGWELRAKQRRASQSQGL